MITEVKFEWRIVVKKSTPILYALELTLDGKKWHEQGQGRYRDCGELLSRITQGKTKPVWEVEK